MDLEGIDGYSLPEAGGLPAPQPNPSGSAHPQGAPGEPGQDEFLRHYFDGEAGNGAEETLAFARALPESREELVARVRDRIALGFYELEKVQERVSERLTALFT